MPKLLLITSCVAAALMVKYAPLGTR